MKIHSWAQYNRYASSCVHKARRKMKTVSIEGDRGGEEMGLGQARDGDVM